MKRLVFRAASLSPAMASFRYRALYPAFAIDRLGTPTVLSGQGTSGQELLEGASALVIVKSFSEADHALAQAAYRRGVPVYFDLCDNVFVPGYGGGSGRSPADRLRALFDVLAGIVVPTSELAEVVRSVSNTRVPVEVIPDCCETEALRTGALPLLSSAHGHSRAGQRVPRSLIGRLVDLLTSGRRAAQPLPPASVRRLLARERQQGPLVLWFGNHGSPWSNFGISDIVLFKDALERAAKEQRARLVVISNDAAKFERLIRPLAIPLMYLEWSAEIVSEALRAAQVVITPNSLDPFSRCKSANRTVLALAAGVPVVATPTSALAPLRGAVWTGDPIQGISQYLGDPDLVARHLESARRVIEREYAAEVLGRTWLEIVGSRSQAAASNT